jgi:hypothetical protein
MNFYSTGSNWLMRVDEGPIAWPMVLRIDELKIKPFFTREEVIVPLDIQPKQDLYSWLLFQGPLFQRLQQVYALDCDSNWTGKCVFQTEMCSLSEADKNSFSDECRPFPLW